MCVFNLWKYIELWTYHLCIFLYVLYFQKMKNNIRQKKIYEGNINFSEEMFSAGSLQYTNHFLGLILSQSQN